MAAPAADQIQASPEKRTRATKPLAQMLMTLVWFIGTLLYAAGRWDWKRGWISIVVWLVGISAIGLLARRYNPQLMKERANWRRKDTKPFDRVFMSLYLPCVLIQPVIAGFDAVRYRWSSMPVAWVYPGSVLFLFASALIAWVLCTNPFAENSVRIQTDRGHTVITSGPYRFIRHPMYVGIILMQGALPMIWGSLWAFLITAAVALLIIVRTVLEDRTLRSELPGYEEYAARTRYRLLPGVW